MKKRLLSVTCTSYFQSEVLTVLNKAVNTDQNISYMAVYAPIKF
ncbi:hypothetical protein [Leptobacterium flavescens]|nr:hypothetical protein [Leptobacterium flavescens]